MPPIAFDPRNSCEQRPARVENCCKPAQDGTIRLGEISPCDRGEGGQGGDDENRRRPEPHETQCRCPHALAVFAFFAAPRAYCLMNRSVFSCASSSTIWIGGDFIR